MFAVVPAAGIDAHVLQLCKLIASRSPRTSRLLKTLVRSGMEAPLTAAIERDALAHVFGSADYAYGLAAFAEKRPPVFNRMTWALDRVPGPAPEHLDWR